MKPGVAKATTVLGLMLIAGGSLSACKKQSNGDLLVIDPGRDAGAANNKFGKGFGKAFNADPNSEPRNVNENDVTPVSLTTEPVKIE